MNAKVAEIVGDGKLAEEGSRQTVNGGSPSILAPVVDVDPSPQLWPTEAGTPPSQAAFTDENRFATLLGRAALKVWSDLPREAQRPHLRRRIRIAASTVRPCRCH
jgi:hypothetical protein